MKLEPGRFYLSRAGDVWCCFRERTNPDHASRYCVQVESGRVEYFFEDGRYDRAGEREHTLVSECEPSSDAAIEKIGVRRLHDPGAFVVGPFIAGHKYAIRAGTDTLDYATCHTLEKAVALCALIRGDSPENVRVAAGYGEAPK